MDSIEEYYENNKLSEIKARAEAQKAFMQTVYANNERIRSRLASMPAYPPTAARITINCIPEPPTLQSTIAKFGNR